MFDDIGPQPEYDDATKELRRLVSKSGVPILRTWGTKLSTDYGPTGKEIIRWLTDDWQKNKLFQQGVGAFVFGNPKQRNYGFATLGQSLVLMNQPTLYIPLRALIRELRSNDPESDAYSRVKCLCVADFQYQDQGPAECPHSWDDRDMVMEFINERIESKRCTFLSAGQALADNNWWSREFLDNLDAVSVQFRFV